MERKLNGEKRKSPAGRPPIITEAVVAKLEQAFAIDCTVAEACSYADISRDAFYDYLKYKPAFSDTIEKLRQRPVLKARQTIVKALDNPEYAFKYVEKKRRNEFGNAVDVTSGGKPIPLFDNVTKRAISTDDSDATDTGTE